jgi:DNA replication protein DnaC
MKVAGERGTGTCPICDDTGWKLVVQGGERSVVRCDCVTQNRAERLLAMARIPRRYEHCELSNYEVQFERANRSLASARLAAGRFVEEYPLSRTGLLLVGPIGVGKTHLAVGILRELIISKGVPCLFSDYRELLKQIQNSYNDSVATTELEVLRPVFESEVLVLDELGAVKPSEWVWDTVSLILNTRYNENRTTIVTTNFADEPAGLVVGSRGAAREETLGDRIGERMRSRLHEMCRTVKMDGSDFRQRVQSANFR